jgi:hypothetical protein
MTNYDTPYVITDIGSAATGVLRLVKWALLITLGGALLVGLVLAVWQWLLLLFAVTVAAGTYYVVRHAPR